jgi:hypothetical protein
MSNDPTLSGWDKARAAARTEHAASLEDISAGYGEIP